MSFDGTWQIFTNTPMGKQEGKLVLSSAGDKLTGEVQSPTGNAAIENGKVSGNTATWSFSITSPMPMTVEMEATVEGDKLTGTAKLGAFGSAPVEGTRV